MLLNKINLLDKGFVAPLSFCGGGSILQDLQTEYFKDKINVKLLDIASSILIIKCPLYVQLNLMQSGLDVITTPSDNIEAYIPDLSLIDANSAEDKIKIQSYIKSTTEALILNQRGLTMDGCSRFTAQILTPISTYSEIIVYGNLNKWIAFLKQKNLPKEVESYRQVVQDILSTEWKNIGYFI